jgi:hypothetical protein
MPYKNIEDRQQRYLDQREAQRHEAYMRKRRNSPAMMEAKAILDALNAGTAERRP